MTDTDVGLIASALSAEQKDADIKALLSKSMFYYCSGIDPTPVEALYREYPLFIYSDLFRRLEGGVDEAARRLLSRLSERGFRSVLCERCEISDGGLLTVIEKNGERTLLLLVKGDARRTYSTVYGEELLPRCIANIRYEMDTSFFLPLEKEVEYVLGHSYSGKHRAERRFKYSGDYREKEVTLFKRT